MKKIIIPKTNYNCRNKRFMLDELKKTLQKPSKRLQNLPYFWYTKTHIDFHFSFRTTLFYFPNECHGLCRHRKKLKRNMGHSFFLCQTLKNHFRRPNLLFFIKISM